MAPVEGNEFGAEIVRDLSEKLGGPTASLGHMYRDPHDGGWMSVEPHVVARSAGRVDGRGSEGKEPFGADDAPVWRGLVVESHQAPRKSPGAPARNE